MRRVGKWAAWIVGALLVLAVIGALFGEEEDDPGDEQAAKQTATATATPTPTPTPRPNVLVELQRPVRDDVGHRHAARQRHAQGRHGARARRHRRAVRACVWTAEVTIDSPGDSTFRVSATKPGYDLEQTTRAVVTRELSEAEIAAQEAAEREEFVSEATTIDYDQLAKNPNRYKGTKVVMQGQIFQIQEDGGQSLDAARGHQRGL